MSAKILVVDDERDLEALMRRKFRREIRHGEFSIDFAEDGETALEKVRSDPNIDLVISDINMPRMDGLTLLNHLAEYEEQLKTIIISAYGDMSNIRAAMNRGAFDFVTKPIDFHDLLITIKKTLDQLDVLKEAIERRLIAERARSNLSRYVPPGLVETLAARDEPFGPPREQEAAVLFVDIRGFTTMSEAMSPSAVMEMLREFHKRMEAIIFDHGGTLDKYIGDAILATFGVPDARPDDAHMAYLCAREMLTSLAAWNDERQAGGNPPVRVGIGIHHGPIVLGEIGSDRAMEFAVIGDTVNTASRLQTMTRKLDSDLVVSEALVTRARDGGGHAARLSDELADQGEQRLAGRSQPVRVFALASPACGTRPTAKLP